MKDKRELLFNHMEPSAEGGLELTTDSILQAMDDHALNVLTSYILVKTGCHSQYEAEVAAKVFLESEPF